MTESTQRTPITSADRISRSAGLVVERDARDTTVVDRAALPGEPSPAEATPLVAPWAEGPTQPVVPVVVPAEGEDAASTAPSSVVPPSVASSMGLPSGPASMGPASMGPASMGPASVAPGSMGAPRRLDDSRRFATGDRPTMELSEALAPGWFLLLFATAFAGLAYVLSTFVADLVIAFMLVGVFRGVYDRVRRTVGRRPWLASAFTTMLIAVLVAAPSSWLAITIGREARIVYTASQTAFSEDWLAHHAQGKEAVRHVRSLVEGLGWHVSAPDAQAAIARAANSVKDVVSQRMSDVLTNVFVSALHFLIVTLIVFYMFVDGERLKRFVFRLSPLPDDEDALLTAKFTAVARAIIVGSGISSAIQGSLGALSMVAVGFPSAVLWGSVMTLLAFLPVLGPLLVVVPASLYLWLDGRFEAALLFFAFNAMSHLVVENVVKARLIGAHVRLHDLLVFLSILGGIAAFGVMGIVYGPLIVTTFMTLAEFYERHYQRVMARAFARRLD